MINVTWGHVTPAPKKLTSRHGYQMPVRKIADEVCLKHGITFEQFTSRRRTNNLARIRWEACWRARTETTASYPSIGRVFQRDYTTVMHGVKKHTEIIRGRDNGAD